MQELAVVIELPAKHKLDRLAQESELDLGRFDDEFARDKALRGEVVLVVDVDVHRVADARQEFFAVTIDDRLDEIGQAQILPAERGLNAPADLPPIVLDGTELVLMRHRQQARRRHHQIEYQ